MNQTVRILIIEDDKDLVRLFEDFARMEWNLQVSAATTLGEGIRKFTSQGADALLVDLQLPDSQGVQTVHKIAEIVRGAPVIIFSGAQDEELEKGCRDAGADGFLYKGETDIETALRAIIRAAIRHQERTMILNETREEREQLSNLQRRLTAMIERHKSEADDIYQSFDESLNRLEFFLNRAKT